MKLIGVYFGLYVLFTIGIYHIIIVKLEAQYGTWPWLGFLALGLLCLFLTVTAGSATWSMFWGYNTFINLWSVKEMFDQHQRSLAKIS